MTLERLVMEARFATLIALYGEHVLSLGNLIIGPNCGGQCFVLPDGLDP